MTTHAGFPVTLDGETFVAAEFADYGFIQRLPQLHNAAAAHMLAKATEAQTSRDQASGFATAAQNSANEAGVHASSAAASFASLDTRYLGAAGVDPTTDNNGAPLQAGAFYFNTVIGRLKVWNAATSTWELGYAVAGDYVLKSSLLWLPKTAAYTAVDGNHILADVSAAGWELGLTATPGTRIRLCLWTGGSVNGLAINPGAELIDGEAGVQTIYTDGISFELFFDATKGWVSA